MIIRVILAVDKTAIKKQIQGLIARHDVLVNNIKRKAHFLDQVSRESSDLIIVSQSFIPSPTHETIKLLRQLPESPGIVIISDREDPEERAKLLAAGCDAVLYSELTSLRLQEVLSTILNRRREILKKSLSDRRIFAHPRLSDFVSKSPAMHTFMNIVHRVVASDVTLLIQGETGVGKERLARAVHAESSRSNGPFISVNCGALPESLLESELFGHEEGAFTGATRSRRGWFELAHRGTIFLDEIGEMQNHLQVKLLRVLQEKEIQRIGSEKSFIVDVRVIAASNKDLEAEVEAHHFRRDLYYRLSVVNLTIPPLRERLEDIPVLVESYINYLRSRIGREVNGITDEALEALCNYSWPGNVRELINIIERAMLLCNGDIITADDLPEAISGKTPGNNSTLSFLDSFEDARTIPQDWLEKPLDEVRKAVLEQFEYKYLVGLLHLSAGRIGETARRAGIQTRSLYDKMRRYGLRKEDFRH